MANNVFFNMAEPPSCILSDTRTGGQSSPGTLFSESVSILWESKFDTIFTNNGEKQQASRKM